MISEASKQPQEEGGAVLVTRSTSLPDSFHLISLSIQKEGDSYLVGSLELNRFYQLPELGVCIIRLIQEGFTLGEVKKKLAVEGSADVDVDDFITTLLEIGLAYRGDLRSSSDQSVAGSRRRLQTTSRLAQMVFSLPCACIYVVVLICAIFCFTHIPQVRPSLSVFYFPAHLTVSLVLLLILYVPIVLLHESGHMLAAARHGIDSHLGFGTRLWTIVVEADLTGVFSLPRSKRYLPLLAGLLMDAFSVSFLIILVAYLLKQHASPFAIQLMQALLVQTLLIMFWQTNVFLRTDLYYVLGTMLAYPDLDRDARMYLRGIAYRLSLGRFGLEDRSERGGRSLSIIRSFSILWIAGRIVSLYILIVVALPTLFLYARTNYRAFAGASWRSLPYDSIFFTLISALLMFSGLWIWASRHILPQRR
jgi:putative peptide zinc metalloprotease protein